MTSPILFLPPGCLPPSAHPPHTRTASRTSQTARFGIAGLRWHKPLDSTHQGGTRGAAGAQGCTSGSLTTWCSRLPLLLAPMADAEVAAVATAQDLVSVCAAAHRAHAYSCACPCMR